MTTRYDNGEVITQGRIEDESWYRDYQALIEIAARNNEMAQDVDALYEAYQKDYFEVFERPYEDKWQLMRWCILQSERAKEAVALLAKMENGNA